MKTRLRHAALLLGSIAVGIVPFACETGSPTYAVIDNAYPSPADDAGAGPQSVVYRGWWSVTYFATPVPAGGESDPNRVIPATDYAYVLLAPGWDPTSGSPPKTLLPMRTKSQVSVARGDTLHIVVSDEAAIGNCAAGQPLTQTEADLVTQSIFPAEFAGVTYDAATCTATPAADGGTAPADASADAASEAGPFEGGTPDGAPDGAPGAPPDAAGDGAIPDAASEGGGLDAATGDAEGG